MKHPKKERARKRTLWGSHEWADYVTFCVTHARRVRHSTRLNAHDWDDIRQNCLIHVWKNRQAYKPGRPLKPWLKTLVWNLIRNELRNRLNFPAKGCGHYRALFRNPISLQTRTITVDSLREEVRYEPDAIDPRTIPPPVTLEDLGELDERLSRALTTLQERGDPMDVVRHQMKNGEITLRMRSRKKADVKVRRRYHQMHGARKVLQKRYREALNAA